MNKQEEERSLAAADRAEGALLGMLAGGSLERRFREIVRESPGLGEKEVLSRLSVGVDFSGEAASAEAERALFCAERIAEALEFLPRKYES